MSRLSLKQLLLAAMWAALGMGIIVADPKSMMFVLLVPLAVLCWIIAILLGLGKLGASPVVFWGGIVVLLAIGMIASYLRDFGKTQYWRKQPALFSAMQLNAIAQSEAAMNHGSVR